MPGGRQLLNVKDWDEEVQSGFKERKIEPFLCLFSFRFVCLFVSV